MERLKNIKNSLISCVESQMGDLRNADAQELGEVIDMVKDMEEAIYYCTITKAIMGRIVVKRLSLYLSIDIAASSAIKIDTIKSITPNWPISLFPIRR